MFSWFNIELSNYVSGFEIVEAVPWNSSFYSRRLFISLQRKKIILEALFLEATQGIGDMGKFIRAFIIFFDMNWSGLRFLCHRLEMEILKNIFFFIILKPRTLGMKINRTETRFIFKTKGSVELIKKIRVTSDASCFPLFFSRLFTLFFVYETMSFSNCESREYYYLQFGF